MKEVLEKLNSVFDKVELISQKLEELKTENENLKIENRNLLKELKMNKNSNLKDEKIYIKERGSKEEIEKQLKLSQDLGHYIKLIDDCIGRVNTL